MNIRYAVPLFHVVKFKLNNQIQNISIIRVQVGNLFNHTYIAYIITKIDEKFSIIIDMSGYKGRRIRQRPDYRGSTVV